MPARRPAPRPPRLPETSLHRDLKTWLAVPGDQLEARLDGYEIDVLHGAEVIEVQTRNFSAIRPKLLDLLQRYPVRLVHPLASLKWIVRQDNDGQPLERRRSPARQTWTAAFANLIYLGAALTHTGLTIELLLIEEEEIRRPGGGSWRRAGWRIHDRRLLRVLESRQFTPPQQLGDLLPAGLPQPFTARQLQRALGGTSRLAQRMAASLVLCGAVGRAGQRGRAYLYESLHRRSDVIDE